MKSRLLQLPPLKVKPRKLKNIHTVAILAVLLTTCLTSAFGQTGVVRFKQSAVTVSEGIGVALIDLERTGADAGTQISFQTEAISAVEGVDYFPVSETYSFAGTETSVSIAVQIYDNTQKQGDRQFKLTLSNPVDLTIDTPSEVTITIADNDELTVPGFGAAGTNIFQGIYALGTNSTGSIIAGGVFRTFNGTLRKNLARVLPSGELDPSFTPGSGPDRQVWALAVQPDDHILISGDFQNIDVIPRNRIARLTDTGTVDASFNPGTGADNQVSSIELQSNGQILIAGQFANYNGTPRSDVALLNSSGTLDLSFNAVTPDSFFGSTARRQGDHFLVGGFVYGTGANVTNSLMRFDSAGNRDTGFQVSVGDIFYNQVYDILVLPDQKILICGNFLGVNGMNSSGIARLNSNGSFDSSFDVGTGADDTVLHMQRQTDGKILVAGVFTTFDGQPRSSIARLNENGSLDTSFDPGAGADDFVYDALPLADGGTLAGGAFDSFDGYDRFRLAELDANGALRTNPISISSYQLEAGQNLRLNLKVEPGRRFRILSAPTLAGWNPIITNSTARSSYEAVLPASSDHDFFRIEQAFDTP
ncbi:hypothetical protein GC207_07730 [bacterium]|nr:hypothetical protein [bacterium]